MIPENYDIANAWFEEGDNSISVMRLGEVKRYSMDYLLCARECCEKTGSIRLLVWQQLIDKFNQLKNGA